MDILNSLLLQFYNCVPIVKVRITANECDPWMRDRNVIYLRHLRHLAFNAYFRERTVETRRVFCKYRNKLKSTIRRVRREHEMRDFNNVDNNRVWKILGNAGLGKDEDSHLGELDVNAINSYFFKKY